MLTSVFYYNIYKPFIVGNVSSRNVSGQSNRQERINTGREHEASGRIFVLNKSLKNEIVNYARAVSHGVTDLRETTKQTALDMENFNRTVHMDGWEYALTNLANNLEQFATDFNQSAGFLQTQMQSTGLRAFSHEVTDNVYHNRERLMMLGLTLNEEGQLRFDDSRISAMNHEDVTVAIGENISVFENLQSYTQQLMTEPLIEHMRFTQLNYHYNYRLGTMETEGYSLIESGMLFDRLV